jgi:pilus assembly protein CpaF
MNDALRRLVHDHDELADLAPAARRLALRSLALGSGIPDPLSAVAEVADEIDAFGPLTGLMSEPGVTDVLVNGPREVWVERHGRLERTSVSFRDRDALMRFLDRTLGRTGVRLDRALPVADARLSDGSRIHAVLPPIAPCGPLVSIRLFPESRFELDDLVALEMMTDDQAATLQACVRDRRTLVISGRTGTGKSTLLDALLRRVPSDERVVTIEELPELQAAGEHRVSLIARGPNVEGKGAVTLDRLVRAALRMRPDRIVVGEVRGPEALIALEAMSTGHEGSMLTVHAGSSEAVPERLLTLALGGNSGASEASLRRQIADALDVAVHLDRVGGSRRVTSICNFA